MLSSSGNILNRAYLLLTK